MLRFIPIVILVMLLGIFAFRLDNGASTSSFPISIAPDYNFEEFSKKRLLGKMYILNFFASWCVPCVLEHPIISDLQKQYHLPVYGVAWKDTSKNIASWLEKHGNPYISYALDNDSRVAISFGVSGVPETFLIDSQGDIIFHFAGPLTQEIADEKIIPLLKE